MTQIPLVVGQIPAGLSRNQLLSAFTGTRAALLDEALSRLADQGLVDRRAGQVRIPRPEQDEADEKSESALTDQIAETLRFGGLVPPLPSAILSDPASRRCVNLLLRKGTIVRAVDRAKGKELLFHRDAIAAAIAKERLAPLLDNSEGMLVGEISAALGISRKFTMPLLAHLDFVRFTRRVGDRRVRHSAGETTTGHPAEDGWARTVA